jgi:hypothetical protein
MTAFLLGWTGLMIVGTGVAFIAAWRAPVGFEDETGFHFGLEANAPEPNHDFDGAVPAFGR